MAVVASGSRFVKTGRLRFDVFGRDVLAAAPRARLSLSDQPPVMGAVRGALAACMSEPQAVWEALARSAAEGGWFRREMGEAEEGEADAE